MVAQEFEHRKVDRDAVMACMHIKKPWRPRWLDLEDVAHEVCLYLLKHGYNPTWKSIEWGIKQYLEPFYSKKRGHGKEVGMVDQTRYEEAVGVSPPENSDFEELLALSGGQEELLRLRYEQGLTLRECAERLGVSEPLVHHRIKKAHEAIKKALESQGGNKFGNRGKGRIVRRRPI